MKIAHIEIYKNTAGTVTILDNSSMDDGYIVFPIEMIPTISKALNLVYENSNKQSDIVFEEGE